MTGVRQTDKQKEEFLKLFPEKAFNIFQTCLDIGIHRQTVTKWRQNDPEFEEKMIEVREGIKDYAESALLKQIKGGNIAAIIFFLKTQCKDRGYIEKSNTEEEYRENDLPTLRAQAQQLLLESGESRT